MAQKILIIEDDVFLGEVLVNRLSAEGYETIVCTNGKDGFNKISSYKPDIILLDIILPEMNGYEILESKAKDPSIADIPVIVVSNSGQPVEVKRAMSLGVKSYLIKADINPDEAVAQVKMFLPSADAAKVTSGFSAGSTMTKQNGALGGFKVLWVEDDAFLKDIIARRLTNEGCTLYNATDESETKMVLEREVPDIILLDILLPGADGFEILRQLKEDPKTNAIPVIMLSNLSQKSDFEKSAQLGAEKFLVKSTFTLDEIIAEIKNIVASHRHS